nr:hypothetical protein Ccrd_022478 [Ipomoea batatas]
MRNSSGYPFAETEWVATDKICTITSKTEAETYKAVIINSIDILLLGDHEAEAAAGGILEGNAGSFGTQNAVDIVAVVELIVEPLGHADGLCRIAVLNYNQMVGLEERPPLLQEVQISDRGDHDIQLVFQNRGSGN